MSPAEMTSPVDIYTPTVSVNYCHQTTTHMHHLPS